MKSLILKDIYNIGHNAVSMLVMLVVFAFIFIPQSGCESYFITAAALCGTMVITTFSFDDHAKWTRYAMVMPLTKEDIVRSKFAVLFIFSIAGVILGIIFGLTGAVLFHKFDFASPEDWIALPASAGMGLVTAVFFGSAVIPLLFKFGAEKARILSLVAIVVPIVLSLGAYKLLSAAGITLNDSIVAVLLGLSPLFVLLWAFFMYRISCKIFRRQEL